MCKEPLTQLSNIKEQILTCEEGWKTGREEGWKYGSVEGWSPSNLPIHPKIKTVNLISKLAYVKHTEIRHLLCNAVSGESTRLWQ